MSTTADVEAVKTEVVELQETKSDLGDLAQLSKEFVSLPFEPVVGGRAANVSFKLFAFGIIGLGIFSLVNAAQTWGISVASSTCLRQGLAFAPRVVTRVVGSRVELYHTENRVTDT